MNDTYTVEPNTLNNFSEPLQIDLGTLKDVQHEKYGESTDARSWAVLTLITDEKVTVDFGSDHQGVENLIGAFNAFLEDLEKDRKTKEDIS